VAASASLLGLGAMYYVNRPGSESVSQLQEEGKIKVVLIGDIGGTNIRF